MLPAEGEFPSGLQLRVHQRIDEEAWSAPDAVRSDLKAAIQLLEHLPPVFGFAGRLSMLAPDARVACLEAYSRSSLTPLVQASIALKQMAHLFYFANDETWGAIGFDGPWVKTPKPPASSLAYRELLS